MAGQGHNGGPPMHPDVLNQTAQNQIRSIVERVERLNAEKAEIQEQIKEVFAEAKGNGFDVVVLRKVVKIRGMDRHKRMEEEAILDLYLTATGDGPTFEPQTPRAAPPEAAEDEDDDFA